MYEAYIKHFYCLKKGKVKMKNEFKAGDLVFAISQGITGITLSVVKILDSCDYPVYLNELNRTFTKNGHKYEHEKGVPELVHATPENRQALVTLYGEDAVPEIPLRGSDLTRKLLEKQKYVLCWTAAQSDDIARKYEELAVIEFMDDKEGWFVCVDGHGYNHAVPVDMNGNEITENYYD